MTRDEVNQLIRDMLAQLGRPDPEFSLPSDHAPIVVVGDGPVFDRITIENGAEVDCQTIEGEQVAFLTLERFTAQIAREIESASRTAAAGPLARVLRLFSRSRDAYITRLDDYSRQTWMEAQVRLMSALRADWGVRVELHHDEMLRRFPLTANERANARRLDLTVFGLE